MSIAKSIFESQVNRNYLIQLLWEANKKIMTIYDDFNCEVIVKDDKSPLTEADLAANKLLIDGLSKFSYSLPVVSEEIKETQKSANNNVAFWLIDPLDGTKEFIKKNGEFTCNLALIEKNKVTFGLVGIPAKNLVYEGGKEFGSRCHFEDGNFREIMCSQKKGKYRVVASKSHLNLETESFIEKLDDEVDLIQAGSSLKFIKVAEGKADLYPRMAPTSEWDTAAAHAIVEGAGGTVKDLNGNSLVYGKENILNPFFLAKGLV